MVAPLDERVEDLRAGGLGQGGELGERGLGVLGALGAGGPVGRARQVEADEHDLLQADLAVLDLADVLQLGGQGGDAPGGGAGLALQGAVVVALAALMLGGGGGQGRAAAREDAGDDLLGAGVGLGEVGLVGGLGGGGVGH